MSGQFYYGDRYNPSSFVEKTDREVNSPAVIADPITGIAPVDTVPGQETPLGMTAAAVAPVNDYLAEEAAMVEVPVQDIPMVGPVAAVNSMTEAVIHEVPMGEAVIHEAPLDENLYAKAPAIEMVTPEAVVVPSPSLSTALLTREESEHFRTQWNEVQGKFVDDPRSAVQQADALVSEVIKQITLMFAEEHSTLENQWSLGKDVSTEDLRNALKRYRSFFNRLVV